MLNRRDIVYVYDGTFYGLMTAIFECYYNHEHPIDIKESNNLQSMLFCDYFYIKTDNTKAERVINSISKKISETAFYYIYCVYLSSVENKEMYIFEFLIEGYHIGSGIINRLNLDCVSKLVNSAKKIMSEAHSYIMFIRFKKLKNGVYFSEIEPKGRILPLISQHFYERFTSFPFMIYDITHGECLVYNGKTLEIHEADFLPDLQTADDDYNFSDLWREFFDAIAIKERHNERCQNGFLPKRYRRFMTEFNNYG